MGAHSTNDWLLAKLATESISASCQTAATGKLAADISALMVTAFIPRIWPTASSARAAVRACSRTSEFERRNHRACGGGGDLDRQRVDLNSTCLGMADGGKAMTIGIAAGARFARDRAGTTTLLRVAAVGERFAVRSPSSGRWVFFGVAGTINSVNIFAVGGAAEFNNVAIGLFASPRFLFACGARQFNNLTLDQVISRPA